ncbi:DUF1835 domain-containing protein [Parageobacillus toebii]|nr:hypothetical protein CN643_01465 [Parageobacillus yumthangensis]PUF88210.1 DUF1835 domain-containing protein [Geobacillus sp. LYN3]RDV22308.1 DUF1835 domain-containing protein [Parageobacillus toebii]TXK87794.1 DUF1835 domain-containing protein [Geobacillus sp. AYS3]TXK90944.1 DUF1835 domain-containing protein [Parageobacillus sp. SY1]
MFMSIHIVFSDSAAGGIKAALREMGIDQQESVLHFSDIFSIGPIWQLHKEEGRKRRADWLRQHLSDSRFYEKEYKARFQHTIACINMLPEQAEITIWSGENAHEQIGLRYVLYLLREKTNHITVINSSRAHSDLFTKQGVHYSIWHTGEIPPEKLRAMMETRAHHHVLSLEEKEQLIQEWGELAASTAVLRLWTENEVTNVPEDYYDQEIIATAKQLQRDFGEQKWIKAARLVGEVYGNLHEFIGDLFIEYRLKALIGKGMFMVEGSLESMRYYSVRYCTSL